MAVINEAELKRHIKEKAFARLYVIYGDESYLKQHYAVQLGEQAVSGGFRDFNFHRFEGKDVTLEELARTVETLPLGSERSCVLLRDYPLEGSGGETEFLRFLRELPAHVVLLFWMDTADFRPKSNKALLEALQTHGQLVQLSRPDQAQLLRLVQAGAKRRGCTLARAEAEYLLETVGGELNNLLNELEKLCAYAGGGALGRDQIDAVCVKSVEAKSFDMVKAVAAGDGTRALLLLDELFRQKIAPQMLLGSLVANYVDLFRAGAMLGSGRRADDAAQLFDYKGKAFRLSNAARMASRMKLSRVCGSLAILDAADRRLKSTGLEPKLVMEQCLFSLLGQGGGA
ncbi:MAG: DNA polymerase III subunit delta [Oscillospiraceae bacterium]|nr:DNA polymerase III subunit delta [Oscillospiraceae bacterium]